MRAVRSRDTGPEMTVRRLTHSMGYRYRLHVRALPGAPDLVFSARRAVIFVHGCFWHQHDCPRGSRIPKTRREYWLPKLRGNRERDGRHQEALAEAGWRVLVIWECQLRDESQLRCRIRTFLDSVSGDTRTLGIPSAPEAGVSSPP